ncbi:hypothetical protein [Microbacterium sp. ZW T5_56]|uniref:hypothetical protein n=1 Tax=Microbacterium sp. ZW T5_56 TaxID=3378081 RepID=UPI0038521AFE
MTEGKLAARARDYLRELDRVLVGVDATTAAELRGGIAESLQGLDEAAAATRIAELGDPAFVAASARDVLSGAERAAATTRAGAEVGSGSKTNSATGESTAQPATGAFPVRDIDPTVASTCKPRTIDDAAGRIVPLTNIGASSLAYVLSAVAVYALAGFLLPVIGWIGGVVMLWISPVWRRAEKWAATLIPLGLGAVVVGFGISTAAAAIASHDTSGTEVANPLLPGGYDLIAITITAGWIVLPLTASGMAIWLIIRALMRTGRLQPTSTGFATAAALVFALGGFVLPVVGWFVGIAMVSASAIWRRWQKVVAAVVPIAAAVAAIIASAVIAAQAPGIVDDPTGSFQVPNPTLDQPLLLQWNIPLALWPILPAAATLVAAWLLLEIHRRRSTSSPTSSMMGDHDN